ncbi:uncharacterized protein PITG_22899 [Phytophthora infestans T30-4]|uniref:Jacalin-type lectin domain-containing protein n=1 Tax=Phytophthora infestans (strain T30-4) TaxID=403677 RepID=D0NCR7_PHYIT|nr:uncharacterized protein PITG_22899 [Phytophthora infestans T30-4]EEY55781.1 conserved hypothetical protein [Phytophthora infestans T30-4]|eukprot:XP_002903357.1 conserved hypothetical protein [Phytophthora infestans T30-4]
MRVLHLVLAVAVAFVAINDGVSTAAKTALRSDSTDFNFFGDDVASDDTVSEERRTSGGGRGGRGGGGGGGGGGGRSRGVGRRARRRARGAHEEEGEEYVDMPPGTYLGPLFGGPHGDDFTDADVVKSGQKVKSINIRASERVDAVMLTVVSPTGEENTLYHGGDGGDLRTPLDLGEGEYITVMEAHWGKHEGHTRIKYIKFTTNKGRFIEGGSKTGNIGTDTAREGYQLGGFDGRSGDELDMVSAIWTSIQPVV